MADERISGGDEEFEKEFAAEKPATPPADDTPPEGDAPPASDEKEEEEITEDEPDEIVVPIRKSTAQHIIARKNRTIEKLRSKDGDGVETPETPSDEIEEDDITPDGDVVAREVRKQMEPIINTFISSTDEAELKELLSTDPNAKKYEKRIRAYMENPHWKAIPPSAIYHHLAFEEAAGVKQREKKKKVADLEAGQSQGGGSQRREVAPVSNIPTADDIDEMDDATFEELQNKARSGAFVNK